MCYNIYNKNFFAKHTFNEKMAAQHYVLCCPLNCLKNLLNIGSPYLIIQCEGKFAPISTIHPHPSPTTKPTHTHTHPNAHSVPFQFFPDFHCLAI